MEGTTCTKTYTLNDGTKLPAVGLGTFQGPDGMPSDREIVDSVVHALHNGYRLIDSAMAYGVEKTIGRAIRESGVPRSDIVVLTKFWINYNDDPGTALQISLDHLGLDYIDVFLMHWPCAMTRDMKPVAPDDSPTFIETWTKMEALVGDKCRAIGVCNMTQKTLDRLLQEASIVPVLNQVELHAFNPNHRLLQYCTEHNIHIMGWRTIGGISAPNDVLTHPVFVKMAENHGCSAAVISLSWAVQRGCSVIPHSRDRSRIRANIKLVTLSESEMDVVNAASETIDKYRLANLIPPLQIVVDSKKTVCGWTNEEHGWEDGEGNWLC